MPKPPPHVTGNFIDITGLGHIGVCGHDPEICEKPISLISTIDFKNKTVTYIDLEGEPPNQKVKEETKHGSVHFFIDKDIVLQLKTLAEQTEEFQNSISTADSKPAETAELIDTQSCPGWPPAEPPSHGRGWPQETVPYPISRAMEFCLENCQLAQCKEAPIGSAGSGQQKCKFPRHCSIFENGHYVHKQ